MTYGTRKLNATFSRVRMEEGRRAFKIFTDLPIGQILLGRPRRIWADNFRMDLKDIGINTRNWVHLAQDRVY